MNVRHWNLIAKMVAAADIPSSSVEDVGRKREGNEVFHEFIINGISYEIRETPSQSPMTDSGLNYDPNTPPEYR